MKRSMDIAIIEVADEVLQERTASRVVAGAIAKQFLKDISFQAYVSAVGPIEVKTPYQDLDFSEIEKNAVRCPDPKKQPKWKRISKTFARKGTLLVE